MTRRARQILGVERTTGSIARFDEKLLRKAGFKAEKKKRKRRRRKR